MAFTSRVRRLVVSLAVAGLLMLPVMTVVHSAYISTNAECFRGWRSSTVTWGGTGSTSYSGAHTLRVRLREQGVLRGELYDKTPNWDINSTHQPVSGNGDWWVYTRFSRDGQVEVATDECQVT